MKLRIIALFFILALVACKSKPKKVDLSLEVSPQDTVQMVEPELSPEPVVEIIDEGVNQDDKYFLVINSYTMEEVAQSWNEIYLAKGFKSEIVMKNDDGYFRLALKSFNDLQLAKEALNEMQKEDEYSKLWIMPR